MQSENSFSFHALQIVKAVVLSVLFCVGAVLLLSLLLMFLDVSDTVLTVICQCVKALSVLFGCFFALRGRMGWLKGLVSGIFTAAITYLLFTLLGGDYHASWLILLDLLFGAAAGILSGIVAVNVKS